MTAKHYHKLATAILATAIAFLILFSPFSYSIVANASSLGGPSYNQALKTKINEAEQSGQITQDQGNTILRNNGVSPSNSDSFWADIASTVLNFVLRTLQYIAGVVLYLGAKLITFLFQFNTSIITLPIVISGWAVSRDIANLGFVLALIIMAFMTILRVNQYNAQKLLPKLIAAAIVVNFSLTIGGAILDFTNVVTKFFVDNSLGNGTFAQSKDVGSAIAGALNPQRFLVADTSAIQDAYNNSNPSQNTQSFSADLMSLASLFIIVAFTLLMALILLANGLMLIARFVWLAILLAVAPLPWLFGILPIPSLQNLGKQWWQKFMQWAFVAPFLSFFLYLTLRTATMVNDLSKSFAANPDAQFTLISGFLIQATNALVLGGFLVGGLLAANSMGAWGGHALIGVAQKTGEKVKGFAQRNTAGRAGSGIQKGWNNLLAAGSKKDKEGKSWLERKAEGKLSTMPFLGAALSGMAGASKNAKRKMQDTMDKSYQEDKKHNKDALQNKINRQLFTTSQEDLGTVLAFLEKGGKSADLDPNKRAKIANMIRKTGTQDKFAQYDPALAADAGDLNKTRSERLEKYVGKIDDVSKLDKDAIKDIAPYLRQQQIRDLGNKGTKEQKETFIEGIKSAFVQEKFKNDPAKIQAVQDIFDELDKQTAALDSTLKAYKDAKDLGEKDQMKNLQGKREEIQKKIDDIRKTLTEGGTYEVKRTSNLVGASGQPQETVAKTITIDSPVEKIANERGEERTINNTNARKTAIDNNVAASKQSSWQGAGLYTSRRPSEEGT